MGGKYLKKIISIFSVLIVLICVYSMAYPAANKVEVSVDGTLMPLQPGAYMMNGSVYAPIDTISSAIGATVKKSMNGKNEVYTITKTKVNREIQLESKNKKIKVNGVESEIDIEPILIARIGDTNQQYVLVPVKLVVERLGGETSFNKGVVAINSYKPIPLVDKNLEAIVRSTIKIPSGELYLGDLTSIKTLLASGKGISSIEDLKYFRSLSNLDLSKNNILDFSPLRGLKSLSILLLSGNPSTDYAPVAAFYKKLNEKDFELKAEFKDKKIEEAVAAAVKKEPKDLALDDLLGIKELNLSGKEISNLKGIDYMANLTKLDISKNNISNIDPLRNLPELQQLTMNTNKVESAVKLGYLTNLVKLDLNGNKIPDMAPLTNCIKLKELLLNGNSVSVIYPIKSMTNLEKLDLSGNNIADVTGIEKLTGLKELYLSSNRITDISFLRSLVNLQVLDLSKNSFTVTNVLEKLTKLKSLYISSNKISDLTVIGKLKGLQLLDLRDNSIERVDQLAGLTGLVTLYLKGNKIVDDSPLKKLTKLKNMDPVEVVPTTVVPIPEGTVVMRFYIDNNKYTVNNAEKEMDTTPIIKGGKTFLPIKYVTENIGAQVIWDDVAKKVTITSGKKTIVLFVNKDVAKIDGNLAMVDAIPFISEGRTMLPLRFVSENLGLKVAWEPVKKEVTLTKEK